MSKFVQAAIWSKFPGELCNPFFSIQLGVSIRSAAVPDGTRFAKWERIRPAIARCTQPRAVPPERLSHWSARARRDAFGPNNILLVPIRERESDRDASRGIGSVQGEER